MCRALLLLLLCVGTSFADGNRLSYLNGPVDPYYVHRDFARLTTPQWAGEQGVDAVVVLAIDDMRDTKGYEAYVSVQENVQKNVTDMEEFFMSIQVWGTPEMCYDKIKSFTSRVNAGAYNGVFSYAGMPYDLAEKNIRLFARDVMPEIRKLPGQPLNMIAA